MLIIEDVNGFPNNRRILLFLEDDIYNQLIDIQENIVLQIWSEVELSLEAILEDKIKHVL